MNRITRSARKSSLFAVIILMTIICTQAFAGEKVIHSFGVNSGPQGGLTADANGNLYGTASGGGKYQHGYVFELSPPVARGKPWTEKVLYNFKGGSGDLSAPMGALVFDTNGNLYGTTGGAPNADPGGVFELQLSASGRWKEAILHIFQSTKSDGWFPETGLIIDSSGNLYGTTFEGGASEVGVVFQLVPPASKGGAWTENLLYQFTGAADGGYPSGQPVFSGGELYGGVTWNGKNFGGLVYELTPSKTGPWTENVLYTFSGGSDGEGPGGQLVQDTQGNFYGATVLGGLGYGVVFELSPSGSGWNESVLYNFTGGSDGNQPRAGVIRDGTGVLYGTTLAGGTGSCPGDLGCGSVFKLSPPSGGGNWTESTLYDFTGGRDGGNSYTPLLLLKGLLFGTTYVGGSSGGGVAFQVKP